METWLLECHSFFKKNERDSPKKQRFYQFSVLLFFPLLDFLIPEDGTGRFS
jgi:hypothetical protein